MGRLQMIQSEDQPPQSYCHWPQPSKTEWRWHWTLLKWYLVIFPSPMEAILQLRSRVCSLCEGKCFNRIAQIPKIFHWNFESNHLYLPVGCGDGQVDSQQSHTELGPSSAFHLNHKQCFGPNDPHEETQHLWPNLRFLLSIKVARLCTRSWSEWPHNDLTVHEEMLKESSPLAYLLGRLHQVSHGLWDYLCGGRVVLVPENEGGHTKPLIPLLATFDELRHWRDLTLNHTAGRQS